MLLRCCLIHLIITILRHILYLVCLCQCLSLGLFVSYLCRLFSNFSLIFLEINHRMIFKQRYMFFTVFKNNSYNFLMITWMKKAQTFQLGKVYPQGVA